MKTTRAMLVIGILMLVLAVIVAQGLRPEETATVSGASVSGRVTRAPISPPPHGSALAPVPDASVSSSPSASGGSLASGQDGISGMDAASSSRPAPISPVVPSALEEGQEEGNGTSGAPATPSAPPDRSKAETERQTATPRNEQRKVQEKPEKLVVTTTAPKKLAAGQKAISRTRLEIGPDSATFRLTGASALQGNAFALKEPDRIVVDLAGSWGINLGRTPSNALIKSVRAGTPETNTRLVFDLHKAPKSFKLVRIDPKTLELQMR